MRSLVLTILLVLILCCSGWAVTVLESGYTFEAYASYSGVVAMTYSMVFDDAGNLYLDQPYSDIILRVTPGGTASVFANISNTTSGFDWTGGTAYGDCLYTTSMYNLVRIAADGTISSFASGLPAASEVAVDRTGNYGGYLYVSTGGQDHIYRVTTGGSVSMFTNWPGWTDGGGPIGLEFDTTGRYGGSMYAASYFGQSDADISGLFAIDTSGNATRFTDDLVAAWEIGFDTTGYFGYDMFVVGNDIWPDEYKYNIWRVAPDGTATEFATTTASTIGSLAFGPDGAMYISEYTNAGGLIMVSRVIPEPGTILLLGLGGLILRRRRAEGREMMDEGR